MVYGSRLIKGLTYFNFVIANRLYRLFFGADNRVNTEFFVHNRTEINERPLFRKVYRVCVYLERVFAICLLCNMSVQFLQKFHPLFHITVCLVAFKLCIVLEMLPRLPLVAEDSADFKYFRVPCYEKLLLPKRGTRESVKSEEHTAVLH